MAKKDRNNDYFIPNYVIHALIAGFVFLLAALVLAVLIFGIFPENPKDKEGALPQSASTQSQDTRPVLLLDAGHGGSDPGALDENEQHIEAEITQIMLEKLEKLLKNHDSQINIQITRQPGEFATTKDRANTAQRLNASLLVSLHLNADTDSSSRGFQVYPVPPGRINHEESLKLATLIAEHVKTETKVPVCGSSGIFYAYYHQGKNGDYWQEIVDSVWVDKENPSQSQSFGVLENSGCPGVLVEQWFISNKEDMALMNNEKGQNAMARALYLAICDYFNFAPVF